MSRPDTGAADARLARALANGGSDRAELHAALVDARVFAAVTATATGEERGGHGLRQESGARLAVVLLEAADGRRALPVFPDLAALTRWRPEARPVPLTGAQACAAALDEGAEAVLLDPAGAAVSVHELRSLAARFVPVPGRPLAARRADSPLRPLETAPEPGLVAALRVALAPEGLLSARLLEGPDGLVVGVAAPCELAPAELAALADRLVDALGDALPPAGLDLAQVTTTGPGTELLRSGSARVRRWGRSRRTGR